MNVSLRLYNNLKRLADSYINFHTHSGFEIVYYRSGTGTTQIDKKQYDYEAGCFAVIQPGCRHDEYRRTTTDVMFLMFYYDNSSISLPNGVYIDSPGGTVRKLLERIADELASKSRYYDILLNGILTEVIVEVGRIMNTDDCKEPDNNLVYAKNYIEQYHSEKIDLHGLASTLGYSYDYFRHLFKAYTGYSPMQYAVQQRLESAKQLLVQSRKSITEISVECGFSNGPQFCMMFKKQVGVSPKHYRDAHVGL
jgi:YesN/AraC family two-component response regulator